MQDMNGADHPPAPTPPEHVLGFLAFFRALSRNPITAWSRAAYEEPFVHMKGSWTRPDMLFVADPTLVRRIFLDNVGNYDKGDVVRRRLQPALGNSMLIANESLWRPQRRLAAPLFSPRTVDAFLPQMVEAASGEANRLDRLGAGSIVDMYDSMIGLTYDIIARTLFSAEGVSDPAAFSRAIAAYFDTLGRVDFASYVRLPEWVPTLGRLRARPALALFRREIGGVIDRRRAALAQRGVDGVPDDLLTRLLVATDPETGQGLDPSLVYDDTITFLAAGHETTANTLCWVLFLLSRHPDWDERLAAEIGREFRDGAVTPAALARLVETRMVVEEALRLYPPAPIIPRVALAPDEAMPVSIKAGTMVFTAPWVSHRHRAYWDQPDAFRPERFAVGRREAIDRFVYFPFGAGPRICIGAGFAMQETLVVLATLLARFRFTATEPDRVFPMATITLRPGETLPMRIERRRRA